MYLFQLKSGNMESIDKLPKSIFEIEANTLSGNIIKLEKFRGKCLLIVNIDFDCGQKKENFEKLRELKRKFPNDLEILLFPCNQFNGTSSMDDENNLLTFVQRDKIDFAEIFTPVSIVGSDTHPLFAFLKSERPGVIAWNFAKFIVSKNGREVIRFNHRVLFSAIETEILKMI